MDNTPKHFTSSVGYDTFKNLSEVLDPRDGYPFVTALKLDSTDISNPCFPRSNGIKRKWSEFDESSLVLGLGPTSSSCITMSFGKEIESNFTHSGFTKTLSEGDEPKLDLELSLSNVPSESENNTAATHGSLRLVDEGSTSFRWKQRLILPPLQSIETSDPSNNVDGNFNHHKHKRNLNVKMCQYKNCMKGARGALGFCIAHGGGRRCQKEGCQKGAEGKTVFCKAHGGGKRCQNLGCTKSAEGRTEYCIGHGGGRRCSNDGCRHAARGKSGLCIRHGGGKRCKILNCGKSADGISALCISHGGGRRCHRIDCPKGAQGGTLFCKAHGGGKRCTFLGCTKGAEGSTPFCKAHGGGKRCTFEEGCTKSVHGGTLFCVNHGGGKRCAITDCTKSARGRTSFCVRHGGGKRCIFEGCGKSAQGRTDFCKAHGGGNRCSWDLCNKFARGKFGMCASHTAQAQHKEIPNKGTFGSGNDHEGTSLSKSEQIMQQDRVIGDFSLPEGRVHGGGLMAMLRGSTISELEVMKSHAMPHKWV